MDRTGFCGRYHLARACALLIALALIVALAGCGYDPNSRRYELNIESTGGGSVTSPGEGISTHSNGTVVDLIATPEEGYRFAGWTGDVDTIGDISAPETTILINGNYSITASFEEAPPVLYSLTVSNCAGGSVTAPGVGTFYYQAGVVVGLSADPATGYLFARWSGDVASIADIHSSVTTIVMNGDHIIEPGFETYWIEIWDWYDLDAIREDLEESYLLMTDLDATTPGYEELAGPNAHGGKGWRPIADGYWNGTEWIGEVFAGNVHGQGHVIGGLVINRPQDNIGLFGCVGTGGTVEAVGIVNADLVGRGIMGSLVAYNDGGTVNACYSSGRVRGNLDVGGLVGWNWGTVSNCHSTAIVSSGSMAGGLVGWNSLTLRNSYAAGSVEGGIHVGGLVGGNGHGGVVSDSYSASDVYGQRYVGGLVGYNVDGATVTRCYSTGSVSGLENLGGLVGRSLATVGDSFWDVDSSGVSVSDGGKGKGTAQMMAIATYTDTGVEGLAEAWDIAAVAPGEADDTRTWNIVEGQSYPFLWWER